MKMKSILLLMLALCLTICLCACGDDTAPDTDDSATTTTPSASTNSSVNDNVTTPSVNTSSSTPDADDPTQPDAGKANYTVIVTDEAGNPVSGALVQLCLESCIPGVTNDEGVASYANMTIADYKVSFINVPAGYELPTDNFYFENDSYEMTLVLKAAN